MQVKKNSVAFGQFKSMFSCQGYDKGSKHLKNTSIYLMSSEPLNLLHPNLVFHCHAQYVTCWAGMFSEVCGPGH